MTTARPPWSTVPMGVLAGRPFEPAKRSAVHGRHRELGATVRWAGDWRRAYDYGDPEGEALAVQTTAGLIDVSTLGKLHRPRARRRRAARPALPEPHVDAQAGAHPLRRADLATRAASPTTARSAGSTTTTFYVTTTSSGAARSRQWFTWWLADWGLRRPPHRRHAGRSAAMNLAGPQAREILRRLTDADCSNEAFTYLDAQHATVAGVPCLVAAHRLRRRGRLRAALRGAAGPGAVGRGRRRGRAARSGSSRSASCACRSCTSSSARTRTRSRRRTAPRCGWIGQARQGAGLHRHAGRWSTPPSIRPRPRWSASRARRRRARPRARSSWSAASRPAR